MASATEISIPEHVDPSRHVDYNIYGDKRFGPNRDLHEALFDLGEEVGRGIFWTHHNGGHWLINSYDLLFEAVTNPEVFSSSNFMARPGTMVTIPSMHGEEPYFGPNSLDPPEHLIYRKPLMQIFSPKAVREMESGVRRLASALVEGVKSRGRLEFLDAIGEPLPVTVFLNLMRMPVERLPEFRSWMNDMASDDLGRRNSAFSNVHDTMAELIEDRRRHPGDDLVTRLLNVDLRGSPPTQKDMDSYCLLLFTAGLDTLVNAFSLGAYQLGRDQSLQEELRADRSLIPEFIEEVLRRYGVSMPARIVTRDCEFGGATLKRGDLVLIMLPAGNLDPARFEDPLRFDIHREDKTHLTFNSGPHRCVGSHLARLEMRVLFEEWFDRMPNVRLDPAEPPTFRAGMNLTVRSLPLVW